MLPFQIEICDRDGRVVIVARITEVSGSSFLGEVLHSELSQELKELLDEYDVACQSGAFGYVDLVQGKLLAFELRVAGIPGQETPILLTDFQLSPDGSFSLDIV